MSDDGDDVDVRDFGFAYQQTEGAVGAGLGVEFLLQGRGRVGFGGRVEGFEVGGEQGEGDLVR